MTLIYYLSHPQIVVDPQVPVPEWSLSDEGNKRMASVINQNWVKGISDIFTSAENKARQSAAWLSKSGNASVTIVEKSGEIDRSSTGYVPHREHEKLADMCFSQPESSAHGWERAVDAQSRIYGAVKRVLNGQSFDGAVAFCGHGGVGTLLACALGGMEIDRRHDQPGGGHGFAFTWPQECLLFTWRRLEEISTPAGN